MADDQEAKRVQGRSPPFPFIPLERAMGRLSDFSDYSRGHPVRMSSAVNGAWGYNPKSSGGIQTVAALKGFGLISDSGSNEDRRVQVSELGKRLLRHPPPIIRKQLLQEAALKPRVLAELWKEWGEGRPPDDDCIWTLTDERGFTPEAATKLLSVYDATITYAGLTSSDSLSGAEEDMVTDFDGSFDDVEGAKQPKPVQTARTRPAMLAGREAPLAAEARSDWVERLRDREGLEIVVEFSREPSPETYGYLRDYINFKLGTSQPGPSDPRTPNQSAPAPSGVSLMITQAQKAQLRALGISDEDIMNMTPADAHKRLGVQG